jgi:collagenase-like PrtC family protease
MNNASAAKTPELLSPAGSLEALSAAVRGGADAVYFGGKTGNARASAKNFTNEEIVLAINILKDRGKKSYITLNTLHTDRELKNILKFAELCYGAGADAFILQDLGLSRIIKYYFPEAELHASTQAGGHNSDACRVFEKLGFSRMIAARELDAENLKLLINESPIEIEMFIHGALCSSHSGRCFMSFALGNTRSANRGSCAQPCRLEYTCGYSLSLKDQCLAAHLKEIIKLAPAALKIEGRMKRPEYVYYTTKIYRECLDNHRDATEREIEMLAKIFSRQGFTDGYFKKNTGVNMYGVRTQENKEDTHLSSSDSSDFKLHGGVALPKKSAVYKKVPREFMGEREKEDKDKTDKTELYIPRVKNPGVNPKLVLVFSSFGQFLRVSEFLKIEQIFKRIYRIFIPLPFRDLVGLESFRDIIGIKIPHVIFDSEKIYAYLKLVQAKKEGVKYALIDNTGHINIARDAGFGLFGNAGLNISNAHALEEYKNLGFTDAVLSPELKFAQMRDINKCINTGIIAYGPINILISENCLIKNAGECKNRHNYADEFCEHKGRFNITDKTGAKFPVAGDFGHRSIVYNSVPVYLADKRELYKNLGLFFISLNFTTESPEDIKKVISAYISPEKAAPPEKFTRGYK